MNEFDIIKRYFVPLAEQFPGSLLLRDDAAVLDVPAGQQLVVTKDAISEGIHFIGNEDPAFIAQKLLRTNLSDLAAMGATPWCYFLSVMLPHTTDEAFIKRFCEGLAIDQKTYAIHLAGGDTIATNGTLSFSLTAHGLVPYGQALKRSGAKVGDHIYITGTIGDSALGLRILQNKLPQAAILNDDEKQFLINRYLLPQPRVQEGLELRGVATACMDVSDGLVQDAQKLCAASGVGAEIHLEQLPLSEPARKLVMHDLALWPVIYNGGDDYELIFTVPYHANTKIGAIVADTNTRVLFNDKEQNLTRGFAHFTE